MAVNEPSPRAKSKDEICLHCHKSLATHVLTVIHMGADAGLQIKECLLAQNGLF